MEKSKVIALYGYLADVKSEDGFIWSTSRCAFRTLQI